MITMVMAATMVMADMAEIMAEEVMAATMVVAVAMVTAATMAMAAGTVMTFLELPALSLAAMVIWVAYFEGAIDADASSP